MSDKKQDWHYDQNGYKQANRSTESRIDQIDDEQKEHDKLVKEIEKANSRKEN